MPDLPTTREVVITGRPGAGAFDPEIGTNRDGGVTVMLRGEEVELETGDRVVLPVTIASGLVADGLAIDPPGVPVYEVKVSDDADEVPDPDLLFDYEDKDDA